MRETPQRMRTAPTPASDPKLLTSDPVSVSQIVMSVSSDPQTMRFPSGEETEVTAAE
jgi:hypothetical protein